MNSTHEDSVLNFDLDFLHPTVSQVSVPPQKLKYITLLKRRIIRVDALQNHTNNINQELGNKSKELEETKKKLESITQEYTQTSLDYQEALESSAKCDRENVKLRSTIKKLEEEHFKAVNDYDAIKSHVAQLEQLVKQQEKKSESQERINNKRTEKIIEERVSAKTKENEKEILLWKKKYETLHKQLQDFKCKLNKEALRNHEKISHKVTNASIFSDPSDNEDDMSTEVSTTVGKQNKTQKGSTAIKDNIPMELDNDCNNEIVSVDLGYGSSLASSDNEKWLNSPDYVFSPINAEILDNHPARKLVTTGTSPIQYLKTTEIATSPIHSLKTSEIATSPIPCLNLTETLTSSIPPLKTIEIALNPLQSATRSIQSLKTTETATSPIRSLLTEIVASPIQSLKTIKIATSSVKSLKTKEKVTSPIQSLKTIEIATSSRKSVPIIDLPRTIPEIIVDNISEHDSIITDNIISNSSKLNISPVSNVIATTHTPVETVEILSTKNIHENSNDEEIHSRTDKTLENKHYKNITQETQEKEYLELNNSNNMYEDCSADNEIEMILNVMRLNHKLITPIPRTPGKKHNQLASTQDDDAQSIADTSHSTCLDAAIAKAQAATAREEAASAKEDAAKTREDNGKLMTTLSQLMKDMFAIKSFLKNTMAMPDTLLESNTNYLSTNCLSNNNGSVNKNYNESSSVQLNEPSDKANLNIPQATRTWAPYKKNSVISEEIMHPAENVNFDIEGRVLQNSRENMKLDNSAEYNIENTEKIKIKSITKDDTDRKCKRHKKLTNLAKYRKKCELRKYKIKSETPPLVKPLKKPKQTQLIKHGTDQAKPFTTSATLNDTQVYAKAVKVMAELNAKTKVKCSKDLQSDSHMKPQNEIEAVEEHINDNNICEEKAASKSSITSIPETVNSNPIATATSPCMLIKSPTAKLPPVLKEPIIILPRCSIESLEKSILSPKSSNISRKRVFKSPELCDESLDSGISRQKCSIKSPEIPVSSLNNNVRMSISCSEKSPKHFIAFTELPIDYLKDSIISPKVTHLKQAITSPRCPVATSELSVDVEEQVSTRMDHALVTSPRRSLRCPLSPVKLMDYELTNSTLKPALTSPKRSDITFSEPPPSKSANSPLTYSGKSITSPRLTLAYQALSPLPIKYPRSTPKSEFTSPKRTITSPELPIILSKSANSPLTYSGKSITSPRLTFAHQPLSPPRITSPRSTLKSPELHLAFKEYAITSPKHSIKSPETTVSIPQYTITSPKAGFTFPNPSIKADSASKQMTAITSPKVVSESLSYIVSSPVPSRITRSQSKFINDTSEDCVVELNAIPQVNRKRTLSNGSDSLCKKIYRKQSINENKTKIDKNIEPKSEVTAGENSSSCDFKDRLLCGYIDKYGVKTMKQAARSTPGSVLNKIIETIEKYMLKAKEDTSNDLSIMNELVEKLQQYDHKDFVLGLIQYLMNPQRKMELFGKSTMLPAPPMTRSEQIMLYVLRQLREYWEPVNIVEIVLSMIEHTVFKLNRTPEFDAIESLAHFYALVCRYCNLKSRLSVFMLDAMYCIQFKAVPLIKQCLDVWPHVIPLAHMSVAKAPLVICFVYLLHFFKCEDKYNRVQDMRNILNRKYFYQMTEWNEKKILELFKTAITELKDIPIEKKMLRTALIIFGKRNGPRWTQNNIIKKILQPLIEKDRVPNRIKAFCISLLGPLMKPYPADMNATCEIVVNQLSDIKKITKSREVDEAILYTLIMMNRHNPRRVTEILLKEKMRPLSPELDDLLRSYIRTKPTQAWLKVLSRIPIFDND